MATRAIVKIHGEIEIPTQGWNDTAELSQIKKQARDETQFWTIMVKKGNHDPVPLSGVRVEVTDIIIPVKE